MSRSMTLDAAVKSLDEWYASQCDGIWEHRWGITIETTDNPGWLVTFKDLQLNQNLLANIVGDLLREHSAQVAFDGMSVRVFAPTFSGVLRAAGTLIVLQQGPAS